MSMKESAIRTQELEAKIRDQITHVSTYKEQIALLRGSETECNSIRSAYHKLKRHSQFTHAQMFCIDSLNSYVIKYGGAMCAYSVMIPSVYFSSSVDSTALTAKYLTNSTLLVSFANAIKDVIDALNDVPKIKGLASRMWRVNDEMRCIDERSIRNAEYIVSANFGPKLELNNVNVAVPTSKGDSNGLTLLRAVSLNVEEGMHTVIRGQNGVGKTSIFRTIGGLWDPLQENDNSSMTVPRSYCFVPQDPVFALEQPFRSQITYPDIDADISDADACRILDLVGLGDKFNTMLNDVEDWPNFLSGGQKQRVSWARLFYQCPKYAFIDEGTSQISHEAVDMLFDTAMLEKNITCVTISHSQEVDAHHKFCLQVAGDKSSEVIEVDA